MHIEKIKIKNFKCFYDEFSLSLEKGLNIIAGDNEAGKSTIIEAIHLALSGWFNGRYFYNELNQCIFNNQIVAEYLKNIKEGQGVLPPSISIEVYFSGDSPHFLRGNKNSEQSDLLGLTFQIKFDEKYKEEYEFLLKEGSISSLPIEYYHYYWESFARDEKITPRLIPIKSALIDSVNNRNQNGSDIYISRIIKDFLKPEEVINVSQAHRKMKDFFMQEEAIKAINEKIQTDSKISNKKVELSVELSSKNAWENSLVTYLDEIPFHHLGKGEQSIIKTKLALNHKKIQEANVLLIEEPENHLSHSRLNYLINELKTGGQNKQIIISTHSSFVANKLGLDSLILLNNPQTTRLSELTEETFQYFQKLSGYDTLRLILCKQAILVEGDSDELIVQKAYADKYDGKLPIENGVDVISVGTSFLRFLEIADKIEKPTIVITDTDWSIGAIKKKYGNFIGKKAKPHINISFDYTIDEGDLLINGRAFNYNTLEPKILKANSLKTLNEVFETVFVNDNEILQYMYQNKTKCALKIFNSEIKINYPSYISDVI